MEALKWIAGLCGIFAVTTLALAIGGENPFLIVPAASLAIAGVLFAAFERAISLLTEIRDALTRPAEEVAAEAVSPTEPQEEKSVEQLKADLDRMKAGLPVME